MKSSDVTEVTLTIAEWDRVEAIPAGGWDRVAGYMWIRPPGTPGAIVARNAVTWPTPDGPTIAGVIRYNEAGTQWTGWLRAGRWVRALDPNPS